MYVKKGNIKHPLVIIFNSKSLKKLINRFFLVKIHVKHFITKKDSRSHTNASIHFILI